MQAFEAAGITRLFPVFSREPGKPKTYVQEAIKIRPLVSASVGTNLLSPNR